MWSKEKNSISEQTSCTEISLLQFTKYFARFFYRPKPNFLDISYTVSYYLKTRDLTAVRQEVNNLDSSDVVQELELKMNLALYGLLWSLDYQYIVGSLSWRSLTFTGYFTRQIFSSVNSNFSI